MYNLASVIQDQEKANPTDLADSKLLIQLIYSQEPGVKAAALARRKLSLQGKKLKKKKANMANCWLQRDHEFETLSLWK